jgi:hypothetical protein
MSAVLGSGAWTRRDTVSKNRTAARKRGYSPRGAQQNFDAKMYVGLYCLDSRRQIVLRSVLLPLYFVECTGIPQSIETSPSQFDPVSLAESARQVESRVFQA